jgi:AhpC/TSA family
MAGVGMKKVRFLFGIFMIPAIAAAGQVLINAKAPDFSLADQTGLQYSLATFAGHPVVLLASDKAGEEQNHQWRELIVEKYGSRVRIVGAADVRTVPFFLKGKIKNDFKKDQNVILLDWDGILFTSYGLAKGVSNVILIDGSGNVRYLHRGSPSDEEAERLFNCIDAVPKAQNEPR